jgi:hypothetical protein
MSEAQTAYVAGRGAMGFAFLTAFLGTISFFSFVVTSQPWQVFGWTEVNYGEIHICVTSVNLTREEVSV